MSSSFLQSKEWFDFQRFLGRSVFFYEQGGIQTGLVKMPLPFKKSYLHISHGPVMDFNQMTGGIDNEIRRFLQYLKILAKKEQAIFIKAEPINDSVAQFLAKNKFKKSKKEIQPSKTVVLDLTKSADDLLDRMHHKTRYNIKVAEKHGIVIKPTEDLKAFCKLLKKTTKRDRFSSHPKEYYEKLMEFFRENTEIKTNLVGAFYQNQPVAGAIILTHSKSAYYLHGASDYNFRKFMAPYMLHWDIIKYLKGNGFENYDFWGIDSRRWPGVTRFKLGWGGRLVEHPGSFDKTVSWWWHLGYKISRRIF